MLRAILERKRMEVRSLALLDATRTKPVQDFAGPLRSRPFICEIKRKSPSRGSFPAADPVKRALAYAEAGAGAVSVLTDGPFFGGSYRDLADVAKTVDLPVLCKDFIVSAVQVENAYRAGADAVLLIAAALEAEELAALTETAKSRGMAVLFEIHEERELEAVLALDPDIVGVNARNLKTMAVDLDQAASLLQRLPDSVLRVAESGVHSMEQVAAMRSSGADAFLVGTALMETENPAQKLAELMRGVMLERKRPCS